MVKRLRESGFTAIQAEAVTVAVQEAGTTDLSHLTTKDNLKAVEAALKADLSALRVELKDEIKATAAETKADILRWVFGAMAAQTALIVGLVKLLGH